MLLSLPESLHFRDRLRDARAATLEDAENFVAIVQVLEDLGKRLRHLYTPDKPAGSGFGSYVPELKALAQQSSYPALSSRWPVFHTAFQPLLDKVRIGRNETVHQGVFARHLADSALELSLLLEDALAMQFDSVQNFMVRSVAVAQPWQPLSFIRLTLLKNSFSYLPVELSGEWKLVSDFGLALYLSAAPTKNEREGCLAQTLEEALSRGLEIEEAFVCPPETIRAEALSHCNNKPILVVSQAHLLGLATPFDLL